MVSAFLNEIQLTGCQSITLDAENGKSNSDVDSCTASSDGDGDIKQ